MKYITITFVTIMMLFTIGCTNNNDNAEEDRNARMQHINYETPKEQKQRLGNREPSIGEQGGYIQSEQRGLNAGDRTGDYTDMYTNEDSVRIADHLNEWKEIKQAQVAFTDKRVVVGVLLNDHSDHHLTDRIREEVAKFVPDREIVVYTDEAYWEKMKNLDSRIQP